MHSPLFILHVHVNFVVFRFPRQLLFFTIVNVVVFRFPKQLLFFYNSPIPLFFCLNSAKASIVQLLPLRHVAPHDIATLYRKGNGARRLCTPEFVSLVIVVSIRHFSRLLPRPPLRHPPPRCRPPARCSTRAPSLQSRTCTSGIVREFRFRCRCTLSSRIRRRRQNPMHS